jgi:VIT1/CCC1 family predicted Fe2+/Mn2+ transporter
MGVPIADQNTELSSSSRRNIAPFLQQSGIRPCINVMAACVDLEDVKPMAVEGTVNEKNHHQSGVVPAVHYSHRAPWLRALVLGANDGLVSIASLMMGVEAFHNAARSSGHPSAVSGLAGLVAGACSMAIGEYVSVFSQRDSQLADLEIERQVRVLLP